MLVDLKMLDRAFKYVSDPNPKRSLTREKLHTALIKMGPKDLKVPFKKTWSENNPTTGFCYVVSEFVYHYLAPTGSKVMRVFVSETKNNHYFIQWPDGTVIDFTVDQFKNLPPYAKAKGCAFQTPSPSKRTKELAELLGYDDEDIG